MINRTISGQDKVIIVKLSGCHDLIWFHIENIICKQHILEKEHATTPKRFNKECLRLSVNAKMLI